MGCKVLSEAWSKARSRRDPKTPPNAQGAGRGRRQRVGSHYDCDEGSEACPDVLLGPGMLAQQQHHDKGQVQAPLIGFVLTPYRELHRAVLICARLSCPSENPVGPAAVQELVPKRVHLEKVKALLVTNLFWSHPECHVPIGPDVLPPDLEPMRNLQSPKNKELKVAPA